MRGCALDSGSQTADTEIVRISHCGAFYLDNRCVIYLLVFLYYSIVSDMSLAVSTAAMTWMVATLLVGMPSTPSFSQQCSLYLFEIKK